MLLWHHLLVTISLCVILVMLAYVHYGSLQSWMMWMVIAVLAMGVLVDLDHFIDGDPVAVAKCAFHMDYGRYSRSPDCVALSRGPLHAKQAFYVLAAATLSFYIHLRLDRVFI